MTNTNSDIRSKTTMLKSSLCDYNDAYIIVKEGIIITGSGDNTRHNAMPMYNLI